jgi:hypothetical protein
VCRSYRALQLCGCKHLHTLSRWSIRCRGSSWDRFVHRRVLSWLCMSGWFKRKCPFSGPVSRREVQVRLAGLGQACCLFHACSANGGRVFTFRVAASEMLQNAVIAQRACMVQLLVCKPRTAPACARLGSSALRGRRRLRRCFVQPGPSVQLGLPTGHFCAPAGPTVPLGPRLAAFVPQVSTAAPQGRRRPLARARVPQGRIAHRLN